MTPLNPRSQYADDRNLAARQRLWAFQDPPFDLMGWALDLAAVTPGDAVLDVGCGNGAYVHALVARAATAFGCDLSTGMLRTVRPHPLLVNADVVALPWRSGAFDVVLAPHMLYHVPDRPAAARELRRALRRGGVCVAVTNGAGHMGAMRTLVERAVHVTNPSWVWRNPSTHAFSLDNGAAQLAGAFDSITCVRADAAPVALRDAGVVADYVASVADHYEHEVDRPWSTIVAEVRDAVQRTIDVDGAFYVTGETGAFVCR